ncbi:hypothetical protein Tco_1018637 [Tanacetum coccineum]|uniref:Uncharacterized protein n=1 Tax=Tanacetum coccineum TaxID=301880 RepID=A0ABQ5FUY1_9ASTR
MLSCLGSSKEAKEPNLQISVDTIASADVPSSVTKTSDTTSTLQPPPPPLQKPTGHRDIWEKVKDQKSQMNLDCFISGKAVRDIGYDYQ